MRCSLGVVGTLAAALLFSVLRMDAAQGADSDVRLNQIQVIGTHNSYHAGLPPSAAKLLGQKNPKALVALDYRHPSLTKQLDEGVRQLELDIFADPQGGLYAHPAIDRMVAAAGLPADPAYDPQGLMTRPGFKVMHVQDIDQRSVCEPFTACLAEVRAWSEAHRGHLPIFLLIETKESPLKESSFSAVTPLPFTPALFDALDAEIRSIFSSEALLTPDMVRGKYQTLRAAASAGNWPALAQARGKVVFLMDQRSAETVYTQGHANLEQRVLFTNGTPGAQDAAFTEANDLSVQAIDALVREGYLVRTRTDSDTVQARTNDTSRRDLVMKSGAQILSTDYPQGEAAATGYGVFFPGGAMARCNAVERATSCKDEGLETLVH